VKRFSETQKWSDPWFMDLPAKWKLMWLYLLDNCDNAGVWTPNMRLAAVQIGEPMEGSEAIRTFADRVQVLPSGKWHVIKFVQYQYGKLSEDCRPHQQVLSLIKSHGLDTLSIPYTKGIVRVQDKDKDKEEKQEVLVMQVEEAEKPDETRIAVGKLPGRRASTKWSKEEVDLYKPILPIHPDDLALLTEFYAAEIPKEVDYRRTSMVTLLKHWNGELDKARAWRAQNR